MTKNGKSEEFDTSRQSCEKFGFFPGSRVKTPKGPATVIGVKENHLWFHLDSDKGASYWDNAKDYETLVFVLDVQLMDDIAPVETSKQYRVKRVQYKGKERRIVLQNENGPCPLISIGNVLLLQGKINIEQENTLISLQKLGDLIIRYAKQLYKDEPHFIQIIEDYDKTVLPTLETGLIVNILFNNIFAFEKNHPIQIFDYLKIRLVHGWLSDPENVEAHNLISNLSYNELATKIVDFEKSFPLISSKAEKQIRDLLNGSQLSSYGLEQIRTSLEEDEICVFFRNNHFATITKHDGSLHILVTDIGYETERNIVWEKIITLDGDNILLNSEFKTRKDANMDEVIGNLLAIGFQESHVREAIAHVNKQESSEEPFELAISYLNSKNYTC
ncbi:hypothetical protein SAMD00019534_091720 [Acytostelium subglobosum LB1]|uniref:hypothetical protein n=1 Tax=Acytostelium subglobosum LB1 TaxID=1410327 RepID=UPI000644E5CA|nr:hypothetical protein SAMD00019534_091720 [Acytostelium subglobosum LB1]GAM25997.1 hypothetical protein SAMD00019534_091720 [Acytostelium subglobosum LB1]|eukprot:XP_012751040.1 hypothetical protein SAMD00019534_091720 [Acytostelium subglobosum LB1]